MNPSFSTTIVVKTTLSNIKSEDCQYLTPSAIIYYSRLVNLYHDDIRSIADYWRIYRVIAVTCVLCVLYCQVLSSTRVMLWIEMLDRKDLPAPTWVCTDYISLNSHMGLLIYCCSGNSRSFRIILMGPFLSLDVFGYTYWLRIEYEHLI